MQLFGFYYCLKLTSLSLSYTRKAFSDFCKNVGVQILKVQLKPFKTGQKFDKDFGPYQNNLERDYP